MALLLLIPTPAQAQRQMERLDRGMVAIVAKPGEVFVSWRLLGTDAEGDQVEMVAGKY